MSSIGDIKDRLNSVSDTRQITNAMYLLSTSRLKKNMLTAPALAEYLTEIRRAMHMILHYTELHGVHHKFTEKDTVGRALYLVLMGDNGLSGDYMSDLAQFTADILSRDPEAETIVHGRYGDDFLARKHVRCDYTTGGSSIHYTEQDVRNLSNRLIEMYMTDYFNEVYVIYTPYSLKSRRPVCMRLLPLRKADFIDVENPDPPQDMIFAPSVRNIFTDLVPEYITGVLYDITLQANAAENAARMDAMQSATHNADNMIKSLAAQVNTERQLAITNELTETASAMLKPEDIL